MIILIPAYEPDTKLLGLVDAIRTAVPSQRIVVVDDGSGPEFQPVFEAVMALGCSVLFHDHNRGKGAALKTGFAHIAMMWPGEDVVCADCDGQHQLIDINRVAAEVDAGLAPIVLGARAFDGDVPLRSRFGNTATRLVFSIATGHELTDTQTGLRAYPTEPLGWLTTIDGDRFEYELNVLLAARTQGIDIAEVAIETIYLEHNASSHFRPLVDSARIYAPLLKFSLSSLAAFVVDFVAFLALMTLGDGLAFAVVAARVLSSTFNYLTNRRFVFGSDASATRSATRYYALVVALVVLNYVVLRVLIGELSLDVVLAKLATETALFTISYLVQRRYVFTSSSDARIGRCTGEHPRAEGTRSAGDVDELANGDPLVRVG